MTTTTPIHHAGSPRRPAWRGRGGSARSTAWHVGSAVVLLAVLYPIIWVVLSSAKPGPEIFSSLSPFPKQPTWQGFTKALQGVGSVPAWQFFANSFELAALAVVGNVISCSMAAYAFARLRFRGKGVMFGYMIVTLMLPQPTLLIPQYTIFQKLGLVDTYVPLLLGKFLAVDAFFVFLMVQFMRGLPKDLDEAAMLDGCGQWRLFVRIILPLTRPALVTTSIFTFIWSWNDFFGPLIYLQSPQKYTLPMALNSFIDQSSSSDYTATLAMSVLALIPVFAFFAAFQRLLVEGVATSGMKG